MFHVGHPPAWPVRTAVGCGRPSLRSGARAGCWCLMIHAKCHRAARPTSAHGWGRRGTARPPSVTHTPRPPPTVDVLGSARRQWDVDVPRETWLRRRTSRACADRLLCAVALDWRLRRPRRRRWRRRASSGDSGQRQWRPLAPTGASEDEQSGPGYPRIKGKASRDVGFNPVHHGFVDAMGDRQMRNDVLVDAAIGRHLGPLDEDPLRQCGQPRGRLRLQV